MRSLVGIMVGSMVVSVCGWVGWVGGSGEGVYVCGACGD